MNPSSPTAVTSEALWANENARRLMLPDGLVGEDAVGVTEAPQLALNPGGRK